MRSLAAALVLATTIIAPVLAAPSGHHHGHARFHSKRDAEPLNVEATIEERDPDLADVDWSKVSYTYSAGQVWGGEPTPAAAAVNAAVNAAVATPTAAAAAAAATTHTSAAAASSQASTTASDVASDVVGAILTVVDEAKIIALGLISAGINALTSNENVWIGNDGEYIMEFHNSADEDIVLVVWGSDGSWVNAKQPFVTHTLTQGSNCTLSFASGVSGALSAIYSDTKLINGQISNTWLEFTTGQYGVVDISKEVNMSGRSVSVTTDSCVSDMTTCVFECQDKSATSCEYGYELVNCATGSQSGAQDGTYDGTDSGGCTVSPTMTAVFS